MPQLYQTAAKIISAVLGKTVKFAALSAALALLSLLLVGAAPVPQTGENNWATGATVYLARGTQIWTSPSLGSCYHTIVPEEGWAVKVTGGPRSADGRTWYDTSREAAGDPSGGTGWVNIEQADAPSPAPQDPGTYCPPGSPAGPVVNPQTGDDVSAQCLGRTIVPPVLFGIKNFWAGQAMVFKLGVLLAAFAVLFTSGKWGAMGTPVLGGLIKALLAGVLAGGVADLTRAYWIDNWTAFVGDRCGVDPALFLLVVPVLWWALSLLFKAVSTVVAIITTILSLAFILPAIAPDRAADLTEFIQRLISGQLK